MTTMTFDTIKKAAINAAKGDSETISRIENIDWAPDYATGQGYSLDGKKGIIFANWNNVQHRVPEPKYWEETNTVMERLGRVLERAGFETEWSDEWDRCSDCQKALRTSPDSFCWKPEYVLTEGEILCNECKPAPPVIDYIVVVGNIGRVYAGTDHTIAKDTFKAYVEQAKALHGRASGEQVTLFADGEIINEHEGVRIGEDE